MGEQWEWAEIIEASDYGRARREAWLAHHAANAATADRAAVEAHGQTEAHRAVQAGQQGMYPNMSPEQRGQAAAELPATIGTDWGDGRVLERHGHLASSIGPAPARVYLSQVNDHPGIQQGGESPLMRWARGEQ